MKSYEASKWYVKIWRKRWYFYIPFLFIKLKLLKFKFLGILIEEPSKSDRKDLINSWFDIKKHIELTKMQKSTPRVEKCRKEQKNPGRRRA